MNFEKLIDCASARETDTTYVFTQAIKKLLFKGG